VPSPSSIPLGEGGSILFPLRKHKENSRQAGKRPRQDLIASVTLRLKDRQEDRGKRQGGKKERQPWPQKTRKLGCNASGMDAPTDLKIQKSSSTIYATPSTSGRGESPQGETSEAEAWIEQRRPQEHKQPQSKLQMERMQCDLRQKRPHHIPYARSAPKFTVPRGSRNLTKTPSKIHSAYSSETPCL
jgi:hypothetical protein